MREPTLKQIKRTADARNKEAALVILQHPEIYSGIMSTWAGDFLRRLELEAVEPYPLLHKLAGDIERAA